VDLTGQILVQESVIFMLGHRAERQDPPLARALSWANDDLRVLHFELYFLTKATLLDEYLRNADALRVADPNDARLQGWMNLLPNDHHGWLQCNYNGKIVKWRDR